MTTTAADRNDLMPAQEKLEWVTPKISLMEAGGYERQQQIHDRRGSASNLYKRSLLTDYTSNPSNLQKPITPTGL